MSEGPATRERWRALLSRIAPSADADRTYAALAAAYASPGRHYHTLAHIGACLSLFDEAREPAHDPDEVELALWLHDVVYDSRASDNEERSAAWAGALLAEGGGARHATAVERLVLATRHRDEPDTGDAALVRDIDLAILAAPPAEFDGYERAIRAEYAWVPDADFRQGRAELLRGFLARERLYRTARFQARFDARARANLRRALEAPGRGPGARLNS